MTIESFEQLRDVLAKAQRSCEPDYIVLDLPIVHSLCAHIAAGDDSIRRIVLTPEQLAESPAPFRQWNLAAAVSTGWLAFSIQQASSEERSLAVNYLEYEDLIAIIQRPANADSASRWLMGELPQDECPPWNVDRSATCTDDTPPQSKS